MLHIIGIGYKARQGKSTLARYLQAMDPTATQIVSFADDLKAIARVLVGMREKDGPLLQTLGTEIFRKYNPKIWVNALDARLTDLEAEGVQLVIIPDVRFPNEFDYLEKNGAELISIHRRMLDGSIYTDSSRSADHPSEVAVATAPWHYRCVADDGDLGAIQKFAQDFMRFRSR